MSHSPRQTDSAPEREQDQLVLRLAADMRGVSGRIAALRGSCLHQLNDLKAALQTITAIGGRVVGEPAGDQLPALSALVGEMAALHRRFEAQVTSGQRIAEDFLLVAREIEEEAAVIRARGPTHADGAVVSLPAYRSRAENAASTRRRVEVISASLRRLDEALAALAEAQAQGVPEMAALRVRMTSFEQQLPGSLT